MSYFSNSKSSTSFRCRWKQVSAPAPTNATSPIVLAEGVEPTSQRALDRGWRARWREYLDESPSWLVSFVLHLAIFLIVTTASVPWTANQSSGGSGAISLTMGFAEKTQDSQGPEVTLESPPTFEMSPTAESERGDAARDSDQGPQAPVPLTAPNETDEPSRAPHSGGQNSPSRTSRNTTARSNQPADDSREYRVSKYAALLNRVRPVAAAMMPSTRSVVPLTPEPLDPQQRAFDQVVDDFIAFDTGQLRGAAGRAARERFAALGPDALPALVRGLNKSAGIHASCPVGVIAGKLVTTLRASGDPSLREYAINHVGVGVPEDAPHYHRLVALRKHWLKGPAMPPQVAAVIDRLEVKQEGELMELMLALSDAPSDTVIAALRSGDEYLAAAASLAILQGRQGWTPEQRAQLRAAVLHFRSLTSNRNLQSLAGDAERLLRRAG